MESDWMFSFGCVRFGWLSQKSPVRCLLTAEDLRQKMR